MFKEEVSTIQGIMGITAFFLAMGGAAVTLHLLVGLLSGQWQPKMPQAFKNIFKKINTKIK